MWTYLRVLCRGFGLNTYVGAIYVLYNGPLPEAPECHHFPQPHNDMEEDECISVQLMDLGLLRMCLTKGEGEVEVRNYGHLPD